MVDQKGYEAVEKSALKTKEAFDKGNFEEATSLWSDTEWVILAQAGNVDFYNILTPIRKRVALKSKNFVMKTVICCIFITGEEFLNFFNGMIGLHGKNMISSIEQST